MYLGLSYFTYLYKPSISTYASYKLFLEMFENSFLNILVVVTCKDGKIFKTYEVHDVIKIDEA